MDIVLWIFLFVGVYLLANKNQINVATIIFAKLIPCIIGLVLTLPNQLDVLYIFICFTLFFVAYNLFRNEERAVTELPVSYQNPPNLDLLTIFFVAILLFSLTAYHFIVAGIPILGDVRVMRFKLMDSGLLGLPSRSYLIGLPLLYIILKCLNSEVTASKYKSQLNFFIVILLCFLFLTRIFGGFKGGILEVFFLIIIVNSALGVKYKIFPFISRNYGKFLLIIISFFLITINYTESISKYSGVMNYVFIRLFYMSSEPDLHIFTSNTQVLNFAGYFWNDILFQLKKWVEFDGQHQIIADSTTHVFAGMGGYNLEKVVNNGRHVPVTISFISMGLVNFGYLIGALSCTLTGIAIAKSENKVKSSSGYLMKSFYLIFIVVLYSYTIKGNIIYMIFNWFTVFAFIALGIICLRFFLKLLLTRV